MQYFKFKELITTTTGLDNTPEWDDITRLEVLGSFLDLVRMQFGKPIRVNCAFRSKAVNDMVGGSATSAHMKGLAADICALSGREEDNRILLEVLEDNIRSIDQLISYHMEAGLKSARIRFIHVGLCYGTPRMQRLYK